MTSISLRDEVCKALTVEWEQFRERHPRLAAVIDQSILVEQAVACITDDPDFRAAMEEAAGLATSASLVEAARKFVGDWLGGLFDSGAKQPG